jgi:hypothetical protein
MEKVVNTFSELNTDISDYILPNNMLRMAKNVRVVDLNSSSFAVTNIKGTEVKFSLRTGHIPLAVKNYNEILYILSMNIATSTYELGSYPSPDYENQAVGEPAGNPAIYDFYRPFNVLLPPNPYSEGVWSKPFTFDGIWTYSAGDDVKIDLQPEFDGSINCVIISPNRPPRIVNSGFIKDSKGDLIFLEPRQGTATSNAYTLSSLEKETKLILRSTKIMDIDFNSIIGGGQLKFGNYQYMFAYQTEDFSGTDIIGESSICQISSGATIATLRGGDQDEATSRQIRLDLSNLDTDFKYLKVYFKYSSGIDVEFTQYIEFTRPIEITGETMIFNHTGFEDTSEVNIDDLQLDSSTIEASNTSTQIGGFLLLGGITGAEFDFGLYTTAAQTINHTIQTKKIPAAGALGIEGYADPANVYSFLGYMGAETYPFGVRFIMTDGSISPVFPTKGEDHLGTSSGDEVAKGLIRFPEISATPFYDDTKQIIIRHVEFDMTAFQLAYPQIIAETVGYFFVRGERRSDVITSGIKVPTYRVPPAHYNTTNKQRHFYNLENTQEEDFAHVPIVDGMLEAYHRDFSNVDDDLKHWVLNSEDNNLAKYASGGGIIGYMPIYMLEPQQHDPTSYPIKMYDENRWAFLSGDAIVDEPSYVTSLQRGQLYWRHYASFNYKVKSLLTNKYKDPNGEYSGGDPATSTGMHYDFENVAAWYGSPQDLSMFMSYVPEETFASGSEFVSRIETWFHKAVYKRGISTNVWKRLTKLVEQGDARNYNEYKDDGNDESKSYTVKMFFASYFGIYFSEDNSTPTNLSGVPKIPAAANAPIGANYRYFPEYPSNNRISHTTGTFFENINKEVIASNYGNIYPQEGPIEDINNKYTNIEGVSYKQCSKRFAWYIPTAPQHAVYGGDCYITKVTRRMARSGENDASNPIHQSNIDMGQLISWFQESKHNLYLRSTFQEDAAEPTKRDFFPHESGGDAEKYRKYRLKETIKYSQGYSDTLRTKTGTKIDETSVFIKSDLYSRVAHSAKHVPNSFKNGYREFSGQNYQDYDVEMGRIVHLDNYRNMMHVIFEHGIAIGEINQRIQTGSDASGAIFVQPDQVLPPTLGYMSKEIGTQDPKSVLRAASGLYGVDREKKKIWRVRDNLAVISDQAVSAFLEKKSILNPITGYNPKYNEIVFSSDDGWTLCFHEGLEKFTSFYTFVPDIYGTSGRDMYSINGNTGYLHDSDNTMEIYGNLEDCYVEFVANIQPGIAKVFDYLNIISNEITPKQIEFFTFTEENKHLDVLIPNGTGQYSKVIDEDDPLSGEPRIDFRDKKFVTQIPNSEIYNSLLDKWAAGGRMRNKYLIIRITYNTEKRLQLLNTIIDFRYSAS